VAQFPSGDEDNIQELLDLWVACLGVGQDFTDEVDQALDFDSVTLLSFHHDDGTPYMSSGRDI
jgi:hypothetical protein